MDSPWRRRTPRGLGSQTRGLQARAADDVEALNLAPLVAALAPVHDFARRLLDVHAVRRLVRCLSRRPNLAASVIQARAQMKFLCDPEAARYLKAICPCAANLERRRNLRRREGARLRTSPTLRRRASSPERPTAAQAIPEDADEEETEHIKKNQREFCRRKFFAKCMEQDMLLGQWRRNEQRRNAKDDFSRLSARAVRQAEQKSRPPARPRERTTRIPWRRIAAAPRLRRG